MNTYKYIYKPIKLLPKMNQTLRLVNYCRIYFSATNHLHLLISVEPSCSELDLVGTFGDSVFMRACTLLCVRPWSLASIRICLDHILLMLKWRTKSFGILVHNDGPECCVQDQDRSLKGQCQTGPVCH